MVSSTHVEPIEQILKDIDWKTLLFLMGMFTMVQAFTKTGIRRSLSQNLYKSFGVNLLVVGLVMLAGIGLASSLLANIPVVAASILLVKGYFVTAELVPEGALGPLHGLAFRNPPRLRGHDVRGDVGRQRDPHWGVRQCGECRTVPRMAGH